MLDRSKLLTERRLEESMGLDRLGAAVVVELMNAADARAVAAVAAVRADVVSAVELVAAALARGGRLIYVGAGSSGRLGVLDAAECPPTFSSDPDMVQGIIAGGEAAMFRAIEGAEDQAGGGAAAMDQRRVDDRDVVMGIAAGGTTPFVHGALARAKERGARTVFLTCVEKFEGEPAADVVIRPLTGPEVLTGSTRLKAGTATKLVLNQITTVAMVRLGKVYENLMVDLRLNNQKLWDRGARIVATLTGLDKSAAMSRLVEADGSVKAAVVMEMKRLDKPAAQELLRQCDGNLRKALEVKGDANL
jgi:N-acetylmuramic acid 6-phosphate etherase